jgi:hypothetical protein
MLVERFENMIGDKITEIEKKRSWNDKINKADEERHTQD